MRRLYEYFLVAAIIFVVVITGATIIRHHQDTTAAASPAAELSAPQRNEVGPHVLCEDPAKLRSERGPEGPTVYYCAD